MSHLDVYQTITTVVTYLRVSTDAQAEKFSLPAQEKLTREVAARHGWEIAKVYRDEGYSGSWIEKRPAFYELLQNADRRRFDAVIVTDFDRLTRPDNLRDLGRIQEIFIQYDIKIVTLSDVIDLSNDDQWFLSSLLGIVGAKEKKKLVARMKRGIQAKKEAGEFYGGIPPSGYRRDGEGNLALREVTETHVGKRGQKYTCYDWRTVRDIFDLYLYQDVSLKAICQHHSLYFQTLVDILDRAWFYAGYTIQTRSKAELSTRGKKAPREQLAPGHHHPIITSEEARRTLEKRQAVQVAHTRTRQKFPCVGLLRCGECGRPMYVYRSVKQPKGGPQRTYHYYVCQTRHGGQKWFARQKGIELQPCGMPFVRVEAVEEAAWRALETFLISPQVVFDQVGSASHQISLLEKELQGIEQERTELVRRQSRLLDLYERAESNMLEEIDVRISQLKKAQEALKRRQIECEERIVYYRQQQIEPDQVYQILSQIEEIIRFATPAHRQEIFRSLFCEMTVKRDRTLEVSASLPTEGVVQRLSVTLIPPGEQEEKVYQNSQQKGVIPR
jgi:DNA invertase Pin-like site-specific DNA recombinase